MALAVAPNALRVAEWVLAGYFAYTAILAVALPVAGSLRALILCTSVAALLVLYCTGRLRRRLVPDGPRSVLPICGVLLAYKQMGWFAQPGHEVGLELEWVRWDRLVLEDWKLREAVEAFGPVLPETLELLYLLTYAVAPAGLLLAAAAGRFDRADRFLACYAASALAAYALYPYFPSEPPRTVFPGDMLGQYGGMFRAVNWWILDRGGIHTSVFPSGHSASAFGAGFGLLMAVPARKRYGAAMLALASGISVATVYGRYHFAVDAIAGLAVSCIASLACALTFRFRSPPAPEIGANAGQ